MAAASHLSQAAGSILVNGKEARTVKH